MNQTQRCPHVEQFTEAQRERQREEGTQELDTHLNIHTHTHTDEEFESWHRKRKLFTVVHFSSKTTETPAMHHGSGILRKDFHSLQFSVVCTQSQNKKTIMFPIRRSDVDCGLLIKI